MNSRAHPPRSLGFFGKPQPMNPTASNGTALASGRPPPASGRPQPPLPSNPSSFPSSFSTLSPLAPPFTVDRSLPVGKSPITVRSPPPVGAADTASGCTYSSTETKFAFLRSKPACASAAAMVPYVAPSRDSMWCSFSSTATASSTTPNSSFRSVEAAPYYPYYCTVSNSLDDPVPLSNFKGYGGWTEAFNFEDGIPARSSMENSWIDPSQSCGNSVQKDTTEKFMYDDSFGSWHGAHNDSSTLGHVSSESTDWLDDGRLRNSKILIDSPCIKDPEAPVLSKKAPSYFQSPVPTAVKECERVIPNSYDRYISQLMSCSMDSMVHYPAPSFSRHGYELSNVRSKSFVDSISMQDCNYVIKHITPDECHDDDAGHIVLKQNDQSICPSTENRRGYIKLGVSSSVVQKKTEATGSSLVKCFSLGNGSALGQSDNDLKIANSCKISLTEKSTPKLDDSLQTSSELPDQLNIAVDSPCWKGASEGRWHPFGSPEIIEPSMVPVTSGFDDMVQQQKPIVTHSELELHNTSDCYASCKDLSPVVNLSCTDQKVQNFSGEISIPLKVVMAKGIQQPDICGEQNSAPSIPQGIDELGVSEAENINCNSCSTSVGPLATVENTGIGAAPIPISPTNSSSSNTCSTNGHMKLSCPTVVPCELKTSVSSDVATSSQIIVRAMLSLSEVLLRHYCSEAKTLEECDLRLAREIIHNLEVLTGSSSQAPRMVNEPLPFESFDGWSNNKDKNLKKKNETGPDLDPEKHDSPAMKYLTSHHGETNGVAQNFSNSLKESFNEHEKGSKLLPYQNLWIQTESSLCSLKNDVALLKLEMEDLKQRSKGGSASESHVSWYGRSSEEAIHTLQTPVRTSSCIADEHKGPKSGSFSSLKNAKRETKAETLERPASVVQEEELDATFIERLRILKSRYDNTELCSLDVLPELSASGLYHEAGGLKEQSPYITCVDTIEDGASQPHSVNKSCGCPKAKDIIGKKVAALGHRNASLLFLNDREPTGVKASHIADGLAIQSCNPKSQGKYLSSSGSGSLSSEWEHVLQDEYIQEII